MYSLRAVCKAFLLSLCLCWNAAALQKSSQAASSTLVERFADKADSISVPGASSPRLMKRMGELDQYIVYRASGGAGKQWTNKLGETFDNCGLWVVMNRWTQNTNAGSGVFLLANKQTGEFEEKVTTVLPQKYKPLTMSAVADVST